MSMKTFFKDWVILTTITVCVLFSALSVAVAISTLGEVWPLLVALPLSGLFITSAAHLLNWWSESD